MKTSDLKTICFEALDDLKAQNILVLDIRDISGFADWFIRTLLDWRTMAEESQKEEVKFDPITRVEYTRGETNIK